MNLYVLAKSWRFATVQMVHCYGELGDGVYRWYGYDTGDGNQYEISNKNGTPP